MNLFKSLLSSIGVIFGIFIVNSIIAFNFTEAKEFCEFINYGCILGLAVVGIFAMVSKYIHDYGAIRGVLAFLGAIIFFVFLIGSIRDYNIGNREEAAATEYRRTNAANSWSSYGEYKFVLRAKKELGWDGDSDNVLLKRAYASENPERMLQALKEAQYNLGQIAQRNN